MAGGPNNHQLRMPGIFRNGCTQSTTAPIEEQLDPVAGVTLSFRARDCSGKTRPTG